MEIINPMSDEKFDVVCEAAVKLVEQLKKILVSNGLDPEQAANVLAMAAGGVIRGTDIEPDEFMQAVSVSYQMWKTKRGMLGLAFDPPHKRPDFVPVERDRGMDN